MILVANSTPMVGPFAFGREPLMYLVISDVLPTPESPTKITGEG